MLSRTSDLPYTTPIPVGAKHLMSGEYVEVAVQGLHIHAHVRDSLRAIHQHARAVAVGRLDHRFHGRDRAERIGNLGDGDQTGLWAKQLFVLIQPHLAGIVHRGHAQPRALFGAEHLPGNDVGVMLQPGDDDLVVLLNVAASPALGDQIDGLGGSANKDDFAGRAGVEEAARLLAGRLVSIGGTRRQLMRGAMHVGVFVLVEVFETIDDGLRLLRGRRVVEPDERTPIDALSQDWEIAANRLHVERIRREAEIVRQSRARCPPESARARYFPARADGAGAVDRRRPVRGNRAHAPRPRRAEARADRAAPQKDWPRLRSDPQ